MAETPTVTDAGTPTPFDGHRLAEFIYGTVTGMVAISGVGEGSGVDWEAAAAVIIVGALAIWVAHAYAILLSQRVVSGRRLRRLDVRETLAGSWPIVIAGIILALPLAPAAIGLWSVSLALTLGSVIGIALLALMGILAGTLARETWTRRLLMAVGSAGLGTVVVVVEYLVRG